MSNSGASTGSCLIQGASYGGVPGLAQFGNALDASPILKIFQENQTILRKFLRRFTSNRDDIEDVCQETILRAIEAARSREVHEPKAFLFGVAKNVVRKQFERQSRTPIDFVEDFANQEYTSCEPPIEEVLDEQKKMIWFAEVVGMLPNQCQKAFMMKKVFGYSHKEIAGHLNISISTVEKHVANGLRRCGDYLQMKLDPMNSLAARDGDLRSYKHGAAHSRHLNTRGSVSTLTEP